MKIEIKVPSPGESISEVQIAAWLVSDGDYVEKDAEIVEIDSDKATLAINADESGKISIKYEEGETVEVGAVIAEIDTEAKGNAPAAKAEEKAAPVENNEVKEQPKVEKAAPVAKEEKTTTSDLQNIKASPLAKKLMQEKAVSESDLMEFFKRNKLVKSDVEYYLDHKDEVQTTEASISLVKKEKSREEHRKKMSPLRKKIAQRLVQVKNETAMLTTFNEIDMKPVMDLRKKYKEQFKQTHEISLGFMSFFTKAAAIALEMYPAVNAKIDGDEMVFNDYKDIGIAVSSPKGLMVPVLRNTETMTLADIEREIKFLANKARNNKITLQDLEGGTFTITNGGVFGSMMSTPIINPPQSAILGMHNIVERPMAIDGQVVIRPVMYVALSYDHRIIDGKESVGFLYAIKEMIENPTRLMTNGKSPDEVLLGL